MLRVLLLPDATHGGYEDRTVDACLFLGSEAVHPLSVLQKKILPNATRIYPLHPDWMGLDGAQQAESVVLLIK